MMRPSLKLLLLFFCGLGHSVHGGEIINGEIVPDSEMLYMASVQDAQREHICGGFLIREDIVVTAAHCDYDEQKPTSVVLGTHNLMKTNDETMRYNVKKCKHPCYTSAGCGADIMLLKLSKKVQLNDKVQLLKLPKAEINVKDNDKCRVAGWGKTKTNGFYVKKLLKVDVSYMNLDECKKKWSPDSLPDKVMCAGGFTPDGKGACQGDSGGPLLCNGKLVGVVSFNRKGNCTYPDYPNVYTNLFKYNQWINEAIKNRKCFH